MFKKIDKLKFELLDPKEIVEKVHSKIESITNLDSTKFIRQSTEALFESILARVVTDLYINSEVTPTMNKNDIIKIYIMIENPMIVTISILGTKIEDVFYSIAYL